MVSCVAAVHQQRIIHLDIKPENFLFIGGEMKLIDFGSCRLLSGIAESTELIDDLLGGGGFGIFQSLFFGITS